MADVKKMTDFTKDTWKKGGKEIATKLIPIVLTGVGGILVKIINQEKWGQVNEKINTSYKNDKISLGR